MAFRAALLQRADASQTRATGGSFGRLAQVAEALRNVGIDCEDARYEEEAEEAVRRQLLDVDGVLVWANPVEGERDRRRLNAMLEEVAATGVLVSAHPDVIRKMGAKDVLYRTRSMGWGVDTRLYPDVETLRAELPHSISAGLPRVLKRERGNGGDGVWKVALAEPVAGGPRKLTPNSALRVRHAKRGGVEERMTLAALLQICEGYLRGGERIIDQPFQARLTDGMVRCYLVGGRVAGFGEQLVNALYPAADGADPSTAPAPGPRHYFPPTRADFQPLKNKLEGEWLPELRRILGLDANQLPVIWDADFLYGPKDATGADSYVLCEINVSSVFPFPDDALQPLAIEFLERLKAKSSRSV